MTIDELIERAERARQDLLTTRAVQTKGIAELRSKAANGDTTVDDATVDSAIAERDGTDRLLADAEVRVANLRAEKDADDKAARDAQASNPTGVRAPSYDGVARVTGEPLTYTPETSQQGRSFFSDTYNFTFRADPQARERLERHGKEARDYGMMTTRATNTTSFAGLVVPQYLVDQAALVARAGRPTANVVMHMPLPEQGMSLIIPRGTTGAATAIQATENASVQNNDEVWANVTVPVVTIAGQQDVSRQSLERGSPGLDGLVYMDLAGAYAANLDTQVLAGTGSSGQMLGIYNTAGINQASAFGAAATTQTFYTKTAGQLNAVETTRFLAPDVIIMHPRRWNWLLTQLDSSNRPLVVPNQNGPFNALGVSSAPIDTPSVTPVGSMFGLPVITDANVQTSQGTGPEDVVYVIRKEDCLLWEDGDGMPRELRFEQTLGNQLTTKLVVYGYAAFTAGRYPTAVGIVGGNSASGFGLIAPTF